MAQGEVVLDGIVWVEHGEARGDFLGGLPGEIGPLRQAEVLRELVNVRVDGAKEQAGALLPEAEVDAVGGAHHPAQIKEQTLGAAPAVWVREEVRRTATLGGTGRGEEASRVADRCGEPGERLSEAPTVGGQVGARSAAPSVPCAR